MAKKAQPVDVLPAPSSSDDETEDQDASSSSTDDEQQPQLPQKPQQSSDDSDDETEDDGPVKKLSLQQPQLPDNDSDDDDDSDSDSDDSDETQNSPSASAFTIKPIVSKPVLKVPEQRTPDSKPARVKSRAKRPADSEEKDFDKPSKPVLNKIKGGSTKRAAEIETDKIDKVSKSKKSKVSNADGQSVGKVEKGSKSKKSVSGDDEGGEVEEKKSIIKWSEKDEGALLSGIVDFKAETGEDVNPKVDTFYDYVKDLLSVDLTRNQLYEKIKRLKKKFSTNVEKCQKGEEPVFSKPHEKELFELSRKIWGSEGTLNEGNDSKGKSGKKKDKKDGGVVGSTVSTPVKQATNRELFVQEEIKDTIMEDKKEETKDFWSVYPRLCASIESEASGFLSIKAGDLKEYVKKIISGIGEESARELEEGWESFHVLEHQLYAKKTHLIYKLAEAASHLYP